MTADSTFVERYVVRYDAAMMRDRAYDVIREEFVGIPANACGQLNRHYNWWLALRREDRAKSSQ